MSSTAYELAYTLDQACARHPGLTWVVVDRLDEPYRIDPHGPTIYLHGAVPRALADQALLAAIAELDGHLTGPIPRFNAAI